jgi:hypothetical protein
VTGSGKDHRNDAAMYVGKSKTPPLILERESFVIDPQHMHDRRLEIVNMDGILNDIVSVGVRLAVGKPRPYATASHPDGEGFDLLKMLGVPFSE